MQTGLGRLTVHAVRMVVSQFEIFAAVRRRASRLRFPERRPAVRPLFPRARPLHGPATARFRTFRAALTSRWTSILQCAHLLDTDRQVLLDRAAALPAFLRGVPRVDDREPTTGPFSLVAQHRDHHARRNLEDLPVEPGLLPDVFAWTFDRALGGGGQPLHLEVLDRYAAEAGCDRGGQLMQMGLATVGELATLPRQMRHGFQPTARSPRGSRELALGLANPSGRRGAEPRIGDGFAGRQRRKPLHAPVNPDQVAGFLAPPRSGARRARRGLPW